MRKFDERFDAQEFWVQVNKLGFDITLGLITLLGMLGIAADLIVGCSR